MDFRTDDHLNISPYTGSVTDSGIGIASEHLDAIFEPFFTTMDVGKGTGLGLSQAFGFAKQTGGEIGVNSALGAGATFTIYLPRAEVGAEIESSAPPCKRRDKRT